MAVQKIDKKRSKSIRYLIPSVLIFSGVLLSDGKAHASILGNLLDAVFGAKDMVVDGASDLARRDFKKLKEDETRDKNQFLDSSKKMITDIKDVTYNASEMVGSEIDRIKNIISLANPFQDASKSRRASAVQRIREDEKREGVAAARLAHEFLEDAGYVADKVDQDIQSVRDSKIGRFLGTLASGLMEEEKAKFKKVLKKVLVLEGFKRGKAEEIATRIADMPENGLQEGDEWLYKNIASFYDKVIFSAAKESGKDPESAHHKKLRDQMRKAARLTTTGIEIGGIELATAGTGGILGLGIGNSIRAGEASRVAKVSREASEVEKGAVLAPKSSRAVEESKAGESKAGESKAEESKAEESKAEESKAEESKAEDSQATREAESSESKMSDESQSEKAKDDQGRESKAEDSKADETEGSEDCMGRSKRSPDLKKNASRCRSGQILINLSLSPEELLKKDIKSAGFEKGAEFTSFSVKTRTETEFKLTRNRLDHILEGHHKRYLKDRSLINDKSLFPDNWGVEEIVERLEQILLENTAKITSLDRGVEYHRMEFKYNNNYYILGINPSKDPNKFFISQFYPKIRPGIRTEEAV